MPCKPYELSYLSECHLQHGSESEVLVKERNSVLNKDTSALVLVGERPYHHSVDRPVRILAAVEHNLGVGLGRDGKVGHIWNRERHVARPYKSAEFSSRVRTAHAQKTAREDTRTHTSASSVVLR